VSILVVRLRSFRKGEGRDRVFTSRASGSSAGWSWRSERGAARPTPPGTTGRRGSAIARDRGAARPTARHAAEFACSLTTLFGVGDADTRPTRRLVSEGDVRGLRGGVHGRLAGGAGAPLSLYSGSRRVGEWGRTGTAWRRQSAIFSVRAARKVPHTRGFHRLHVGGWWCGAVLALLSPRARLCN
jgi:hypothetical protein